jgi:hypothetical protein
MKFKEPVANAAEGNARGRIRGKGGGDRHGGGGGWKQKEGRTNESQESAVNKTGIIRQSRSDFIYASTLLRFYSAAFYTRSTHVRKIARNEKVSFSIYKTPRVHISRVSG